MPEPTGVAACLRTWRDADLRELLRRAQDRWFSEIADAIEAELSRRVAVRLGSVQ